MISMGIDSGSSTTKGVLLKNQEIIKKIIVPTGPNPRRTLEEVYKTLAGEDKVFCITTGYGRDLLNQRDKSITEITCHAKGAVYLCPEIKAIIDIGGQDSKVILLDENKRVEDFLMNDKCAAGTGRFVEMISRLLHQDLCDLDDYVKDATPAKISSMCTVFAESEVIGLLAQNIQGPDIALGVIKGICQRTAQFANRLPLGGTFFFSGGLSNFKSMHQGLAKALNQEILTNPLGQYAGAIGAAVLGQNSTSKNT